jgi:hypothetical protein
MHPIYIISIIFIIAVIINIFIKIKDKKLILNELIFWILIIIALILISVFPDFAVKTAHFFGFKSGFDFFIALSILVIFLFLFNIYKKIRILEEKFTRLIENIAINNFINSSIKNENEINLKNHKDENKDI